MCSIGVLFIIWGTKMTWAEILDFPNYEINCEGDVRNKKFNRMVAFSLKRKNFTTYRRVTLFKNGHRHYKQVHRLVAEAFIPNPKNLPQVDHIDADGENNSVSNLQWVTASQNIKKSFIQNREQKLAICMKGSLKGRVTIRKKSALKYQDMLQDRFIAFHPSGELNDSACISYVCVCGIQRTASIMWKELRTHSGKCPICTNTVNKSSESLL